MNVMPGVADMGPQPRSRSLRIEIAGRTVLLDHAGVAFDPAARTLLVADLHFGKAASAASRGVFLPPYDTRATMERLASVIGRLEPSRVVCLGDSFHDADGEHGLTGADRQALAALQAGREWIWLAGNHDPASGRSLPGDHAGEIALGPVTLRHEPAFAPGAPEIAGHLHPCARIVQRGRSLRRRCFAVSKVHLVLPAFGALTGSLNVMDRAFDGFRAHPSAGAALIGRDGLYPVPAGRLVADQ